jgi:RHS repeat-associated protein
MTDKRRLLIGTWAVAAWVALAGQASAQIQVNGNIEVTDETTPPATSYAQAVATTQAGQYTFWSGFGHISGTLPSAATGSVSWRLSGITPVSYTSEGQQGWWPVKFYFDNLATSHCGDEACTPFDARLWSRYGSASGTISLEDATPVPDRFIYARDEKGLFPGFWTWTTQDGAFSFTRSEGPMPDQAAVIPGSKEPFPIDPENNWGLPVYGDGAGDDDLIASVSHVQGSALWYFSAGGGVETPAVITGSELTQINITVPPPDADEDDPGKRPEDEQDGDEGQGDKDPDDGKEPVDPCEEGAPPGAAGKPVSVTTGNMYLDQTDVVVGGLRGPVPFTRSYNSQNAVHYLGGRSFGRGWTHSFEKSITVKWDRMLVLRRANGSPIYYTDPEGTSILRPMARSVSRSWIQRSGDGFVRTFRIGSSERYNSSGRLASQTDSAGRTTSFDYDEYGRLTRITIPGGRTLTLVYFGTGGPVTSLLGPDGKEVAHYEYDGYTTLTKVTYADGSGYRFAYDGNGQMIAAWDLTGRLLERHAYQGEKAITSEKADGVERLTFDYAPGRTTVTDALGHRTVYEYTRIMSQPRIMSVTGHCSRCGGQAGVRQWTYNPEGRVASYRNSTGALTQFQYNAEGDRVQRTDALSRGTLRTFDARGRVLSRTSPGNRTTVFGHGSAGPISVTTPESRTTTYSYDGNGVLTSVTDPNGHTTTFERNQFGDLTTIIDPLGNRAEFTYDAYGRLLSTRDPAGETTQLGRDAHGRLVSLTGPDGSRTVFDFDKGGLPVATTDPLGRVTRTVYDAYGRPESVVDPLHAVSTFGYDAMSHLTSITDPRGNSTRYTYDEEYRVASIRSPGGAAKTFGYDGGSRVTSETDQDGVVTTYSYDPLGRVLGKSHSDGTPASSYTYDDEGRLRTASNGVDTLTWTYDRDDRLLSEASQRNGSVVSFTRDSGGNRTALSLDGVPFAGFDYDAASRLTAIRRAGRTFEFTYDAASRRTGLAYPNGAATSYSYDVASRLASMAGRLGTGDLFRYDYTRDAIGSTTAKRSAGAEERYSYDALSRLVGVERSGSTPVTWLYGYDPVGNRTVEQRNDAVLTGTFNNRNQLLALGAGGPLRVRGQLDEPGTVTVNGMPARVLAGNIFEATIPASQGANTFSVAARDVAGNTRTSRYTVDVGSGSSSYAYDGRGNLVSRNGSGGAWTYEWNARNELVRVTRDGVEVARFTYDPLGRRIEKTASGLTTRYTYDGGDILREVRGPATVLYVHGPGFDEPLAAEADGTASYLHADALGSVVKVSDAAGTTTLTREYDAWGQLEAGEAVAGFAFTGREWDPETGLYYYRARYYEPKIGRFISEDPIGFASGAVNHYGYVGNRPTDFVDPRGLWGISVSAYAGLGGAVSFNKTSEGLSVCFQAGLGIGGSVKWKVVSGLDESGVTLNTKASMNALGLGASREWITDIATDGRRTPCPSKDKVKTAVSFGATEVTVAEPGDNVEIAAKASLGAETSATAKVCIAMTW